MKIQYLIKMLLVVGVAGLFGCGGGGGGGSAGTTPPPVAKATTTVSGTVQFPALSSLVAKRVADLTDPVYLQAYTIDGKAVGVQVTADSAGAYSIPNLEAGIDYVIKATRGAQVLKKLIEKATVAPGATVQNQDLSGVSTTAVAVASQKLATASGIAALSLGEPTILTDTQKTALSAEIFTDVSPKALETAITSAAATVQAAIASNDLTGLTAALADLVNTLNIVVAAVSTNTDPSKVLSGQVTSFAVPVDSPVPLKLINIDTSGVVTQSAALTSVTSTQVAQTVTSTVNSYVPPARVQLDISTNVAADSLYGITLEIVIPADAQIRLDANGKPDMTSISIAAGVISGTLVDAQYTSPNRKLRIVIAGSSALPSGKLVSMICDRTAGSQLTSADFAVTIVRTSDANGQSLLNGFSLTQTATASGL